MRPQLWSPWTVAQILLLVLVLIPGLAIAATCGHYLLLDWAALSRAFQEFEHAVQGHEGFNQIYITNVYQQTYRINCFADGVGVLGGLIIFSIGIAGLCLNRRPRIASSKDL